MQIRLSLMIYAATMFAVCPALAQRQDGVHGHNGHHGHHGVNDSDHSGHNGSDHSGHNGDGDDDDGDDDDDQGDDGHGHHSLILASSAATAAVAQATSSVTSALSARSLKTASGVVIPASAQAYTYSVLVADPGQSASTAALSAALSTAGPTARAIVPSLIRSFSGLASHPARLPSTIREYNRFTQAASSEFVANPPPEFVALHTVLAELTAAAGKAK